MALVCYHGQNPHIINQERADVILGVVVDPMFRKIIDCIKDDFKSAKQISQELELPITTTYRYIHELEEKNVLILSSRIKFGKKTFAFKSKIQKVVSTFEGETVDVKIYTNLRD